VSVATVRPAPTVIGPPRGFVPLRLTEVWAYRDLFLFLVWRDIRLRFAQTRIGAGWLVVQPLGLLAVYTFAFKGRVSTHTDVPYPLFVLAGMTAWQFVSRTFTLGAGSLIQAYSVIKRTSCPRIVFPIATVTAGAADFVVGVGLYFVLAGIYGLYPTWRAVFLLPLVVLAYAFTCGLSLLLAPAQVRYRDVASLLPFTVQLWFFLSPVAYALPRVGGVWRIVEELNPMTGILGGFRWALLGTKLGLEEVGVAVAVTVLTLALGIVVFNRAEQTIADDL
jgi:lipopolysaccharide transport system permease protein